MGKQRPPEAPFNESVSLSKSFCDCDLCLSMFLSMSVIMV